MRGQSSLPGSKWGLCTCESCDMYDCGGHLPVFIFPSPIGGLALRSKYRNGSIRPLTVVLHAARDDGRGRVPRVVVRETGQQSKVSGSIFTHFTSFSWRSCLAFPCSMTSPLNTPYLHLDGAWNSVIHYYFFSPEHLSLLFNVLYIVIKIFFCLLPLTKAL